MSRGGKKKSERTLTQELASFLSKVLVPDLRERAKAPEVHKALEKRYLHEKAAKRTAEHFIEWMERTVEQVGAAWVLSCLFIRTLEDRELLGQRRLAGPGAKDAYGQFIEIAPALTARDYLLLVFREVGSLPAAEDVLGPKHNPAWRLSPSHEAARKLLDFFQGEDTSGSLKWTFTGTDTRFLGDLYQDLSEDIRKRYALLQTPHFVEKFILDLTLDPAIEEFGSEQVRLIDPTCGSGHFLLGAFDRLFERRRLLSPGLDVKEHARAAVAQVFGVDLNPYAVAIARFRLTLAFLEKAEIGRLASAPRLSLNLVVADSLLYGGRHQAKLSDMDENRTRWGDEVFDLEDPGAAQAVFGQRYHAVVGNPPYITCKDSALRDAYRERYDSCFREYALAAPFTERFFELAVDSGFVGLINANSFMKREFGKRLIEAVLPRYDLNRVIDTSGAYIPGHGTPTILIFGRNRKPISDFISAVLGKKGEPSTPLEPENGKVWSLIAERYEEDGFDSEFVSVSMVKRATLSIHPWSLGGGGAADLKEKLERRSVYRLSDVVGSIGFGCMTRADDVYFVPRHALKAAGLSDANIIENVEGEVVRDWSISSPNTSVFPYDKDLHPIAEKTAPAVHRFLWPYRALLWTRREPNGNHREIGLTWWEWSRFQKERFRTPLSIAFAFVSTHNHFVLDRGGKVFKQSAPIIKLPEHATQEEHFMLLGYLNSSTACFWMKQSMMSKGGSGIGRGVQDEAWESRFEFDSTKMARLPIPKSSEKLMQLAREADSLAAQMKGLRPSALLRRQSSFDALGTVLENSRLQIESIQNSLLGIQEEIDWLVYELFELLSDDECRALSDVSISSTGESAKCRAGLRPFELELLASTSDERQTAWFERNRYEVPTKAYVDSQVVGLVAMRRQIIRQNASVCIIERPEYKRRLGVVDFDVEVVDASKEILLDEVEKIVSGSGEVQDARAVALALGARPGMQALLGRVFGANYSHEVVLALIDSQSVPAVAAMRYSEAGLEIRRQWEYTWEQQRLEDSGVQRHVDVPPKYGKEDFQSDVIWGLRGQLDVPKERFICYPGAEVDEGRSFLLGWAGWNHLERANALATLYQQRKTQDGWDNERLVPLLAGLLELIPWLQQWHNEPNLDFNGERLGNYYAQFVTEEARSLGLTLDDLRNWRPVKAAKKRAAPRKKKAPASDTEEPA